MADERRLVWASGAGRILYCAKCGKVKGECTCRTGNAPPTVPREGFLLVGRSSKGHAGKTVTTISGVPGTIDELRALVQTLKRFCGSGGTVQPDGSILLQGDVRDRVERKLVDLGFKVKRVGG